MRLKAQMCVVFANFTGLGLLGDARIIKLSFLSGRGGNGMLDFVSFLFIVESTSDKKDLFFVPTADMWRRSPAVIFVEANVLGNI